MGTLRARIRTAVLAGVVGLAATAGVASATAPPPSSYANFAGPESLVGAAGEPSIGYNPKTDAVLFQANTTTAKVDFSKTPPTWTDATSPFSAAGLDPILYTDRATGRTFASQLLAACSQTSISEDDGANWTPSQGCGVGTVFDHQTIGGGPFSANGLVPLGGLLYPNAVYYCAQAVVIANCAVSYDGGQTFGPGVPAFSPDNCGNALHGHLKVAPDGTAYLPNFDCNGRQAVSVSTDNGESWTVQEIPNTTTQDESDPHIGIGDKGTVYFGYQGGDGSVVGGKRTEGHAWVTVKKAGSTTWQPPIDVGAELGIKNIQFPEVYAGDDDRAAFAFLGTTTVGDDQADTFPGVWHLYVATTIDGGATWKTVDATPTDPVQRGCIWLGGGSVACRNLLDFNDITMDKEGRVLVAYADGCTGPCVGNPADTSKTDLGTIARQVDGPRLLKAFDPPAQPATDLTTTTGTTTTTTPATTTETPPATPATTGDTTTTAAPLLARQTGGASAKGTHVLQVLRRAFSARRTKRVGSVQVRLRLLGGGELTAVRISVVDSAGHVLFAGKLARLTGSKNIRLAPVAKLARLRPGTARVIVTAEDGGKALKQARVTVVQR